MAIKIDSKIVNYTIKDEGNQTSSPDASPVSNPASNVVQMHETLERPEMLVGTTYKLKAPAVSQHAMYITINDIILNEGSEHELRRPFEVFINSKNLDHYQWIVALTRIMSAVFRKGGDVTFLVEELRSVFDPRGGYWNNGKMVPSIIAEIGDVIERHLINIGMIKPPEMDEHQKELIEQKRKEFELRENFNKNKESDSNKSTGDGGSFPESAVMCNKCNQEAAVVLDGCMTCLNCGDSKCG